MHAALGGEGGYHLRLAGGCVPSRSYLLELIVTLKPDGKRENMNKSAACTCGTIVMHRLEALLMVSMPRPVMTEYSLMMSMPSR